MFFLIWQPLPEGWKANFFYGDWQPLGEAEGESKLAALRNLYPHLNHTGKAALHTFADSYQ